MTITVDAWISIGLGIALIAVLVAGVAIAKYDRQADRGASVSAAQKQRRQWLAEQHDPQQPEWTPESADAYRGSP